MTDTTSSTDPHLLVAQGTQQQGSRHEDLADPITKPVTALSDRAPGAPEGGFDHLRDLAAAALPTDLPCDPSQLLVAFDIDGTILQADGTASDRMRQAVADLREAGGHAVIATGRSVQAAQSVFRQFDLREGFAVCANGAMTLALDGSEGGFTVIDERTFIPRQALLALREAMPGALLGIEVAGEGFRITKPFPPGELVGANKVLPIEELLDIPSVRVVARAPHLDTTQFSDAVAAAGLYSVEYAIGWSSWLDVAPKGITKASALEALRQRLGVSPSGTVAFGDGMNDVQMLQWARVGVAMGDSVQAVVDSCAYRAGSVAEDGAAAWVQAILGR